MLHEQDPHDFLYQQYRQFVEQLAVDGTDELMLRRLEMLLLDELGYGLVLDADIQGQAIAPDRQYQYIPEQGLVELVSQQKATGLALNGTDLVSMVNGDFSQRPVMQAAKQLTRRVIDFYLGGKQVFNNASGAPGVELSGGAAEVLTSLGGSKVLISLADEQQYAVAYVILV